MTGIRKLGAVLPGMRILVGRYQVSKPARSCFDNFHGSQQLLGRISRARPNRTLCILECALRAASLKKDENHVDVRGESENGAQCLQLKGLASASRYLDILKHQVFSEP